MEAFTQYCLRGGVSLAHPLPPRPLYPSFRQLALPPTDARMVRYAYSESVTGACPALGPVIAAEATGYCPLLSFWGKQALGPPASASR